MSKNNCLKCDQESHVFYNLGDGPLCFDCISEFREDCEVCGEVSAHICYECCTVYCHLHDPKKPLDCHVCKDLKNEKN